MKKLLVLLALFALPLSASTRKNDDSCDIAQMPAATLLLPYFEVHLGVPRAQARTTLFTITNTVREPQIAHITLWTDYGYPVLAWNAVLTGYDVYSVDLRDVLEGHFAAASPQGARSAGANPRLDTANCASFVQPPASAIADAVTALTTGGVAACGQRLLGGQHADRAIGYATIDVVANCTTRFATDPPYAGDLLYDNVLTGDAIVLDPNSATGNYAGATPLVHIRAVPESGDAGQVVATNMVDTFYHRFMPAGAPFADRRQPLPSRFVARVIDAGPTAFMTDLLIWRGGPAVASCERNGDAFLSVFETVRFDERENPAAFGGCQFPECAVTIELQRTSRRGSLSGTFPYPITEDVAGWLYLNLNGGPANRPPDDELPLQAWVTTAMSAEGRYMAVQDATALGNGCSPAASDSGVFPIGPTP